MRTLPVLVLLTLLLLPTTALAADTPPPANLEKLGERLDRLWARIERLIEEASKDPDERKIDIYNAYTDVELKLRKRDVRVTDLAEFMLDSTKNFNVRQKAQQAIHRGGYERSDPDLSLNDKRGTKSKRAYFCDKYLIKHLRNEDDPFARKLVNELLGNMWRVNNVPEIKAYRVHEKKTWMPAYREWQKYLSRN